MYVGDTQFDADGSTAQAVTLQASLEPEPVPNGNVQPVDPTVTPIPAPVSTS